LPSIFSGGGIGFVDLHEQFFKSDGLRPHPMSSHMWDLIDNRSDIARLDDQFVPFILSAITFTSCVLQCCIQGKISSDRWGMKDVLLDDIKDKTCLTELIRRILFLNQTELVSVP